MRVVMCALVVSFAVALASAPAARSDDAADDAYLSALAGQGIVRERGQLIATAKIICDPARDQLVPLPLQVMSALHVLPDQAVFVIGAAESAYCPQ
jgi:hypothetical protein